MNTPPDPRLAVVMPVYNAERFLAETVASILDQSFRDFVLVSVDDGSTDGSVAFLEGIQDERSVLHRQTNSGGPARPRNVGIRLANTEYTALFDSDDLMLPGKLAEGVRVLDACPEAALLISDFGRIDEDGTILDETFLSSYTEFQRVIAAQGVRDGYAYIPPRALYETLCKENFVGTSSVILRRGIIDKIGGFDEQLSNSDDRDMWFRIARSFGAAYIPRPLHHYRVRAGSVTARGVIPNTKSRIVVLQRQLNNSVPASSARELRLRIAGNHSALGYAQRHSGNRIGSAVSFLRAFVTTRRPRLLLAAAKSILLDGRGGPKTTS